MDMNGIKVYTMLLKQYQKVKSYKAKQYWTVYMYRMFC